jgi:hypothetical protein
MKLEALSDKLDEIHVARKYKRLSTAVVCSHLLSFNFSNMFLIAYWDYLFYLYR